MDGNEIRAHQAIAVEEYAVAAARGHDGPVANLGQAKAAVLLPGMVEPAPQLGAPGLDRRGGRRGGAVIGDHDLEIPVALAGERAQDRIERILAVIGRDDDRDQLGHGHPVVACFRRQA